MLTPELVEALQAPISETSPAGSNLEYDPAFTALESASQGKAEQQFGDTVIAAVEPEWRVVSEQAQALLGRSKDARVAVLVLRACTRLQGVAGFSMGLQLLTGLLDRYWDALHPMLDADDNNDPTERLNALAPLSDESTVMRDLYEATVGNARGVGIIRVRDIAIAHGALAAVGSESGYSAAQIDGALESIHAESPQAIQTLVGLPAQLTRLQALIVERTGRADAVDLAPLRAIGNMLGKVSTSVSGAAAAQGEAAMDSGNPDGEAPASGSAPASSARGEIRTRQDAVQTLDRVIKYLEQAEPGNPAPLLIARAKKLIGVSFLQIMADLAPNALDTIETVTGKQTAE
ncbi:type VI secretion system protein TssA [Variovorax sp. J22R133]|uniref:type VI secretion system protein TssA n=1 Tax=Variovorax brevis TaxID=3053503 RepID=UPI0025784768|nr:type VI secretion system protein TssA [Variovorax sp. J22R133]MDM0117218.1 type VI secretion system protein TssA [Variovorax sp. J22R133]